MSDEIASPEEIQAFLAQPSQLEASDNSFDFDDPGAASAEEANAWLNAELRAEKYGGTGQQFLTALEGAASSATFGLSTGLQVALGADPEAIQARREENPVAYGVGQVGGLVASAALPVGGALGIMERAGAAGAKALGLGAAQGTAAKIGAAAVKAGIENTIQQSGDELSKLFTSDPAQTAETALTNITLSGLLGSGIGGAFGSINPLWKATFGAKTAKKLETVAEGLEEAGRGEIANETVQTLLAEQGASLSGAPKPNLDAIEQASARLGITPTTGMRSGEKLAQDIESTLSQRPTYYGQKVQDEVEGVYKGLDQAGLKLLGDASNESQAVVGTKIRDRLVDRLDERFSQNQARYDELKPLLKSIKVSQEQLDATANLVAKHELAAIAPSSKAASAAKRIAKEIRGLKTVDDLKAYRTLNNTRIEGALRSGSEELPILMSAKQGLTDLREQAIKTAEATQSNKLLEKLRAADAEYSSVKQLIREFGIEAGLGKINNMRSLIGKLRTVSPESLTKRFFDTGDVSQMRFMKENFPEEFALAKSFKQKEILDASLSTAQGENGAFQVSKFLTQVKKLSPEARQEIFGKGVQTLSDMQTVYQSMPAKVGPSGTPKGTWMGRMFSAEGWADNLSDAAKYAMLKAAPMIEDAANDGERAAILRFMSGFDGGISAAGFKAMGDFMEAAIQGERTMDRAVRGLFKGVRMEIPKAVMPDEKKREKLDKRLQSLQVNPEALMEAGGETGVYLKGEASHLAQVAAGAVTFLNSLRPAQPRVSPLDPPPVISKQAKAEFNRALDIAEQPLIVVEDIRNGQISMRDLAVLKTIYPSLYSKLAEKMIFEMNDTLAKGETIPYKMRLGLSLFLGQPLDSTLSGNSIRAIQASSNVASGSESQPQQRPPSATAMQGMEKLAGSYMTNQQSRVAQRMKG